MLKLTLVRDYLGDRTVGGLMLPSGKIISSIELVDRDNEVNVSCIPEGTYEVHRDKHGRHTWFKILEVPGRSFIEIHEGYKPSHSNGCILFDLIELQDLMIETKGEPFLLEVTS